MIRRLRKHLTLRELVAVLAAVLVLGSFAIPAFNGYVEASARRARRQRHRHVEPAALSLAAQHERVAGESRRSGPRRRRSVGPPVRLSCAPPTRAGRGCARTASSSPLNTDFDLYSLGPDGESALALPAAPSRDDVVRAGDGAYIGLAVNY